MNENENEEGEGEGVCTLGIEATESGEGGEDGGREDDEEGAPEEGDP